MKRLLPPKVYQNIKDGKPITDTYENTTIIYADIVGFTQWSANNTPHIIIGVLSELFARFDSLCEEKRVYKVHTIGDCYVVMGLSEDSNDTPILSCYRMLQFALEMIEIIKDINQSLNLELGMRIGMHTGKVIAGITGSTIVRYDIYGPDVVIANSLESTGKPGAIHLSEVTLNLLLDQDPQLAYQFHDDIEILSRNIKTYFITKI